MAVARFFVWPSATLGRAASCLDDAGGGAAPCGAGIGPYFRRRSGEASGSHTPDSVWRAGNAGWLPRNRTIRGGGQKVGSAVASQRSPLVRPRRALHRLAHGVGWRKARSRPMAGWHVMPQQTGLCGQQLPRRTLAANHSPPPFPQPPTHAPLGGPQTRRHALEAPLGGVASLPRSPTNGAHKHSARRVMTDLLVVPSHVHQNSPSLVVDATAWA